MLTILKSVLPINKKRLDFRIDTKQKCKNRSSVAFTSTFKKKSKAYNMNDKVWESWESEGGGRSMGDKCFVDVQGKTWNFLS